MKPFGTSSRNNNLNSSFAAAQRSRDPRASWGKENPDRRSSKTPKHSNLSTIGGAYGLGDEFGLNPMRKKPTKKRREKAAANHKKPDPSPLKKPDPSSSSTSVIAPSKQPKSKTSVKSIISSALKRSKSDQFNNKRDAEVGAKVAAPSLTAAANNEYDQLSDMDTACSTPEKESPLIISPRNKPDPPTKSISKDGRRRQSQMEPAVKKDSDAGALHDRKVMEQKNRRPAPQFTVQKNPADNPNHHDVNRQQSAAPMAPLKKKGGASEDGTTTSNVKASTAIVTKSRMEREKVMEAMMNSGKDRSEESRVVGSFVGGASLERSNSDDVSEMTMMDDNVSNTSMTTLGGGAPSLMKKSKSAPSSASVNRQSQNNRGSGIPSHLHLQRVDPPIHNPQQDANLIENETIVSHVTNQCKKKQSCVDKPQEHGNSILTQSYLPAGWKEYFSKSKNRPYWKHPDWGSTWYHPGLPINGHVAVTNSTLHPAPSTQNADFEESRPKSGDGASLDRRNDDESIAKNSIVDASSNECAGQKSINDEMPQEEEYQSTTSSHRYEQTGTNSALKSTMTSVTSRESRTLSIQSKPTTSPNSKRISDDYQTLLAPYQSIEKSVASRQSKGLSIASCRHSKASSDDDISSKCLTQEFATTSVGGASLAPGTPSIGNSEDDPVEFDNADDVVDGFDDEDGLMISDRQGVDMNSLASDHVDVDALLAQKLKHESPMSTIRETLDESSTKQQTPSSVLSAVDFGNDDGMSHQGSEEATMDPDNAVDDGGVNSPIAASDTSSHQTLSNSAINNANKGDVEPSDDDSAVHYDNDDAGQSPTFESNVDYTGESSDEEVEVSQHQKTKQNSTSGLLGLKKESIGSDYSKRKFFPPGPLCSLQFLDEIDAGDFDTPLWRRMKRKRSTLTSVKRGKAAYRASKLRQSH